MSDHIELYEYKAEEVDDSIKTLWKCLAKEMFEFAPLTLPSEANGNAYLKFVKEGLAQERSLLLVAKSNNKIVGFAYATLFREYPLEVSEPFAAVNDLYVLPDFRGRGIGRKLLNECLNRIKEKGFSAVMLNVLSEDKAAIKLYEKLGFSIFTYGMVRHL